jgi:hypothetical protein
MVVSRDIPVIYVPSWRNRWEPTHKALFFHARRRLQGEPRWQSTEVIRRALEPFWMRLNSREDRYEEKKIAQAVITNKSQSVLVPGPSLN